MDFIKQGLWAMNNKIITGSLSAISQQNNSTLAESFLSCDTLLLADMSSSMSTNDAMGQRSRYDAAEADIIRLQEKHQGKVALVVFSNTVEFCPAGVPIRLGGGTDLGKALKFVKVADDIGIQLILISDGEPDSPSNCLQIAKTFKSKIDVVYVGSETDDYGGRAFLKKLAQATGGQFVQSNQPGLLAESVEVLMLGG